MFALSLLRSVVCLCCCAALERRTAVVATVWQRCLELLCYQIAVSELCEKKVEKLQINYLDLHL